MARNRLAQRAPFLPTRPFIPCLDQPRTRDAKEKTCEIKNCQIEGKDVWDQKLTFPWFCVPDQKHGIKITIQKGRVGIRDQKLIRATEFFFGRSRTEWVEGRDDFFLAEIRCPVILKMTAFQGVWDQKLSNWRKRRVRSKVVRRRTKSRAV